MGTARLRRRRTPSLRIRILAIALIPGLVVLGVGIGVSLHLVDDAKNKEDLAQAVAPAAEGAVAFVPLLEAERRASLAYSAVPSTENKTRLDEARTGTDTLAAQLAQLATGVANALPSEVQGTITEFTAALMALPDTRAQIDGGQLGRLDIYGFFNRATDGIGSGTEIIAASGIDAEVATERTTAATLIRTGDWLDRGNALAASAITGQGLTRDEFNEFVRMTGAYRASLDEVLPRLRPAERARIDDLRASPEWQRVTETTDNLIARGFDSLSASSEQSSQNNPLPDIGAWEQAAASVAGAIGTVGIERSKAAADLEESKASDDVQNATLAASLMIVGTVVIFAIALLFSGRLVRRLARLRVETLALAHRSLPDTVEKLRAGEEIDIDAEVPMLDHGRDEIGQVASAFNQAQQTAVRAAVDEARTRAGINAVFLNIARRSQNIVHRQLQVLDEVERSETDPDQLALLFQLDHLATRERRNAENLIILGGQQPGRQWRNPVQLSELVRSAIGETEQYQRVTPGRLPRVLVAGKAVGDLVHLLAELVDNATGFSPPDSPIEISGSTVGRGVVVEVEDQGLGIVRERLEQLNETLRHPPDFSFMTLTEDSRLGLFVVARLAHRHGLTVTLRESAYGGIRAGVLIPTALLETDEASPGPDERVVKVVEAKPAAPSGAVPVAGAAFDPPAGAFDPPASTTSTGEMPVVEAPAATNGEPSRRRIPMHRAAVEKPRKPGVEDATSLPQLPRRRRLAHMDSRLRDQVFDGTGAPDVDLPIQPGPAHSPDTARHRMSAFQAGTRRGRQERAPDSAAEPADVDRAPAHANDEGV